MHLTGHLSFVGVVLLGLHAYSGDTQRDDTVVWPWHVSVLNTDLQFSCCMGVLVAPRVVVTPAHCLELQWGPSMSSQVMFNTDAPRGRFGAENPNITAYKTVMLDEVVVHPFYQKYTKFSFDIALLFLSEAQSITARGDICLTLPDRSEDEDCALAGYSTRGGKHMWYSYTHQDGKPVANKFDCRDVYAMRPGTRDRLDEHTHMCAEHTDRLLCGGNALICPKPNGALLLRGLFSWGQDKRTRPHPQPDVFTDVSVLSHWIRGQSLLVASQRNYDRNEVEPALC